MTTIKYHIQKEEDLFPKVFASYVEKPYGVLFYDEANKNYYDSNHALIYKDQIEDLDVVLQDILAFYKEKNIQPSIYQALHDETYFVTHQSTFEKNGFKVWTESPAMMMTLSEDNLLDQGHMGKVCLVRKWDPRIASDICIPANESYNIKMMQDMIESPTAYTFVIYDGDQAVGILNLHQAKSCTRFDYILIAPDYRSRGYASS